MRAARSSGWICGKLHKAPRSEEYWYDWRNESNRTLGTPSVTLCAESENRPDGKRRAVLSGWADVSAVAFVQGASNFGFAPAEGTLHPAPFGERGLPGSRSVG